MKLFKLFLIIYISIFSAVISEAREELYPFVATVKDDNVNVRSGQSVNFESLGRLSANDEILVLGKKYSWYRVQLPPNFKLFVSEEFIFIRDGRNGTLGEVIGSRVNVRSAASVQSTVLAQVVKGQEVTVVKRLEGWYQIEPSAEAAGWINEKFLKFKTKDVTRFSKKPLLSPAEKENLEEAKRIEVERKRQAEIARNKQEEELRKISLKGMLYKLKSSINNAGMYKVVTEDIRTYIIDSDEFILDDFVDYKVSVDGSITTYKNVNTPYPIIKVNKIQLIL